MNKRLDVASQMNIKCNLYDSTDIKLQEIKTNLLRIYEWLFGDRAWGEKQWSMSTKLKKRCCRNIIILIFDNF